MSSSVDGELSFSPRLRYAGGRGRADRAQQRHGTEGGRVCEAVRAVVSRKQCEPDPNGTLERNAARPAVKATMAEEWL